MNNIIFRLFWFKREFDIKRLPLALGFFFAIYFAIGVFAGRYYAHSFLFLCLNIILACALYNYWEGLRR